jgi:hypothetical protein
VSWSLLFDDPIPLAKGKPLRTLRDAADHVMALPKAKSVLPHWQLAVTCLMAAAEKRGPMMMARIAMVRALTHSDATKPQAPRGNAMKNRIGS